MGYNLAKIMKFAFVMVSMHLLSVAPVHLCRCLCMTVGDNKLCLGVAFVAICTLLSFMQCGNVLLYKIFFIMDVTVF